MKFVYNLLLIILGSLLLTACSGGGGGGNNSNNNTVVPAAPVFFASSTGVFVVDSDGNNRIQLTPDFSSGDQYLRFTVSPNKAWVAILARLDGSSRAELYVTSASGQHFTKVSVLNNAFSAVSGETLRLGTIWSPNSNALIYEADDTYDTRSEIFLVNINSDNSFTMPQKINGPIGMAGNVFVNQPQWSFDGSHIAYRVLDAGRVIGVNTHEVGTSNGDTNFSIRVSKPTFSAADEVGGVYAWSPTANRLVYNGQVRSATNELFLVNASEDEATYNADDSLISESGSSASFFVWSNDGRYVAYRILATAPNPNEWSVYDSTAASPNISNLVDDFSGLTNLDWVPNSNRISTFHEDSAGNKLTSINPDGSNRLEIPIENINTNIALAIDGSLIAVAETQSASSRYRLLFISPTSTTIQNSVTFSNLTTDIDLSISNSWSPNNDRIMLKRSDINNMDILEIINVTNGAITRLDNAADVSYQFQWAPDANKVCASKRDGLTINDLICINPDGSGIVTITNDLNSTTDAFTF